jgi:alpha-beta hydrolase superfamily lysophospholipase
MIEEPLFFDNDQNQRLFGIRHNPAGKAAFPTVILYHGLIGNKSERNRAFVRLARLLCSYGYQVYRFDSRGHGDSFCEFENIKMDDFVKDAVDIFNFVLKEKQTDASRICVISHSMCPALYAKDMMKKIKALVLHAPATYPRRVVERGWGAGIKFGRSGFSYSWGSSLNKDFWKNLEKYNAITSIKFIEAPVLLITGDEDDIIPPFEVRELYEAANHPKKISIIKYADHDFRRPELEAQLFKETIKWLKKYCP